MLGLCLKSKKVSDLIGFGLTFAKTRSAQGQKSAQGFLRLRIPSSGPNSEKRILDARISDPNSCFEFFDFFSQQKGLDPPSYGAFSTPLRCQCSDFPVSQNPRQSRPEALLEGSKNFRESAFSGTFSSPHTFCTPPPYHGPTAAQFFFFFRLWHVAGVGWFRIANARSPYRAPKPQKCILKPEKCHWRPPGKMAPKVNYNGGIKMSKNGLFWTL